LALIDGEVFSQFPCFRNKWWDGTRMSMCHAVNKRLAEKLKIQKSHRGPYAPVMI